MNLLCFKLRKRHVVWNPAASSANFSDDAIFYKSTDYSSFGENVDVAAEGFRRWRSKTRWVRYKLLRIKSKLPTLLKFISIVPCEEYLVDRCGVTLLYLFGFKNKKQRFFVSYIESTSSFSFFFLYSGDIISQMDDSSLSTFCIQKKIEDNFAIYNWNSFFSPYYLSLGKFVSEIRLFTENQQLLYRSGFNKDIIIKINIEFFWNFWKT